MLKQIVQKQEFQTLFPFSVLETNKLSIKSRNS